MDSTSIEATNPALNDVPSFSRPIATKRRIYGVEYRVAVPFDAKPASATTLRLEHCYPQPEPSGQSAATGSPRLTGPQSSEACAPAYKRRRSDDSSSCRGSATATATSAADQDSDSSGLVDESHHCDTTERGNDVTLDHLSPTSRWYVQLCLDERAIPPVCQSCYGLVCVCDPRLANAYGSFPALR